MLGPLVQLQPRRTTQRTMPLPNLSRIEDVDMGSVRSTSSKNGEPLSVSVEPMPADEGAVLEKSVHVRRVFSYAQFFVFSVAYMGVWKRVCVLVLEWPLS